jgi:chemotaxis protein methyltransferase CheR
MSWQEEFRRIVESRIGTVVRERHQTETVHRCVTARVRALDLSGPEEYVSLLAQQPTTGQEFSQLISVLTNGKTAFFRHTEQFEAIERFLDKRSSLNRPLYVWSAACSTGEEPYTLAVLAHARDLDVHILATDINTEFLEIARRGCYSEWSLRHVPEIYRTRYFTQEDDLERLKPEIADGVQFRRHNLIEDGYPIPPAAPWKWDIVLCRNVFIYFARRTVSGIIREFCSVLADDGLIFLGAAEYLHDLELPLSSTQLENRCYAYQPSSPERPAADQFPSMHTPTPSLEQEVSHRAQDVAEVYKSVLRFLVERQYERAIDQLEQIIEVQADHVNAHLMLGRLHAKSRQYTLALEDYGRARDCEPLMPEVHYFPGLVYRKIGDLELAKQSFRRTLFLSPEFWPATFLLGGTYDRLGDTPGKIREYLRTVSILEKSSDSSPFSSGLVGMELDHDLDSDRVLEVCRRSLERAGVK